MNSMRKSLGFLAVVYVLVALLAVPAALPAAEGDPQPADTTSTEQRPPPQQPSAQPQPPAQPPPGDQGPAEGAQADARPEPPVARAAGPGAVNIKDFGFGPRSISVKVGDRVTWTNTGATPHSATASDGSFDTGVFRKGQSRAHTFDRAGSFAYICTPHPFMKGTVKVTGSGSGGGSGQGVTEGAGGASSSDSGAGGSSAGSSTSGSRSGAGDSGARDRSGPRLPASGADVGVLAGLGALMILLGVLIRRRGLSASA